MDNNAIRLLRRLHRAAVRRPDRPNTWWTTVAADDRRAAAQLVAAKLAEMHGQHSGSRLEVRLLEEGVRRGDLEA